MAVDMSNANIKRMDRLLGKHYSLHDMANEYYPNGTNEPGLFDIYCEVLSYIHPADCASCAIPH